MAKKEKFVPQFENLGSLITYKDEDGRDACLNFLFEFEGKGVFDPSRGRVDVSSEHVLAHNQALSKAMIQGLDETCEVEQSGVFYAEPLAGSCKLWRISTWIGEAVAKATQTGSRLHFTRKGRTFECAVPKGDERIVEVRRIT